MTVRCPKGHLSTEPDFCSECGAKIGVPAAESGPVHACPDCNSARLPDSGKFCELCGYNFETGAHGEIPLPPARAAAPPIAVPEKWTVAVSIDPALKEEGSPDPPSTWTPFSIAADRDTLLIGRASGSRAIAPDLSLDFDSAVSHRHAVITRSGNGPAWCIRDVGSSNGTRLNGKDIQAMVDMPLQPGDRVTVGHWTCLVLNREPQP